MLPLPLILAANVGVGRSWAHYATAILAGFTAGVTFLIGALDVAGASLLIATPGGQSRLPLDVGIMATGLIAATLASKPVRERLARILPIDPGNPVHALALVLAVIFFGLQVSITLFTNLASAPQSAIGPGDLIAQDAGLVVLAAAGVGIFVRRDLRQTATRLSLVTPAWWQVVLALAVAGALYAVSAGMVALSQLLTPDLSRQVNANVGQLFGGLVTNPVGIAALAVLPALGEEILFRGALQPRLGLIATALLFTASHSEYGLSLDILSVLVAAFGLGLIRKLTNTTTSAITHAAYNLAVGVGVAASQVDAAIAIELVLVAISAFALWSRWRRRAVRTNS
ncbi:MAG: lysostaphin resistance A-like protein [Candidatus Dormibacteraceae bacterium]